MSEFAPKPAGDDYASTPAATQRAEEAPPPQHQSANIDASTDGGQAPVVSEPVGEISSDNAPLFADSPEQAVSTSDAEFAPPIEPVVLPEVPPSPPAETAEAPQPVRAKRAAAGSLMGTIQSLAITVAIAVFVITFIVQAFQIPSESMENTLLIGDYLLVDKVHYGPKGAWNALEPYSPIRHGDIIVFKYPVNPSQHFVKRVIGIPGDRVRLINKRVFVNGKMLTESYVTYSRPFSEYPDNFPVVGGYDPNMESSWGLQMRKLVDGHELIVPEDSYFVLGDNRDKSLDSRYWGFVPRENVVGRPLLIYFSMRRPLEVTTPLSGSFTDRLHDLTYNLTDLSGRIRWRRAFRLIK